MDPNYYFSSPERNYMTTNQDYGSGGMMGRGRGYQPAVNNLDRNTFPHYQNSLSPQSQHQTFQAIGTTFNIRPQPQLHQYQYQNQYPVYPMAPVGQPAQYVEEHLVQQLMETKIENNNYTGAAAVAAATTSSDHQFNFGMGSQGQRLPVDYQHYAQPVPDVTVVPLSDTGPRRALTQYSLRGSDLSPSAARYEAGASGGVGRGGRGRGRARNVREDYNPYGSPSAAAAVTPPPPPNFHLIAQEIPEPVGIAGFMNSCYMDATLVSLFLYDDSFARCLDPKVNGAGASRPDKVTKDKERVRKILREKIFAELNENKELARRYKTMTLFRDAMSRFCESYRMSQKDPEEFIVTLFENILEAEPFYSVDGDDGAFVLQTYGNPKQDKGSTSVQDLLNYTFLDSEMALQTVPSPGFIIKLPVSDNKHVYSKIQVNLNISLKDIMAPGTGQDSNMTLSAVICLRARHFTAFVKMDTKDPLSPWVYLDSLDHSKYVLLENLHAFLDQPKPTYHEEDRLLRLILGNPYMCVYLPM